MFGMRSLRIGTLFGIPLEVNPTWFIVFILVVVSLSFSYFPTAYPGRPLVVDLVSGLLTALAFFASVVLHEMSHSLVARAGGLRISKITLFIFGGVAQMDEEPRSPGREFVMAFAGPAMSILLALVFWLLLAIVRSLGLSDLWYAPLPYLVFINLAVGLFNLLPGFPLDGGRVLRAVLWGLTGDLLKATRWAAAAGQAIGFAFVALAVLGVLRGVFDFVWLGLIGWFLASIAGASYQQQLLRSRFSGVPVSAVMSGAPVVAPGDIDVAEFIDRYVLGLHHSKYPVELGGQIAGLVDLRRVKAVPREQWTETRVIEITDTDVARLSVDAAASLDSVLTRLADRETGALLVFSDDRLVGIVTRADVARMMQRMAASGP